MHAMADITTDYLRALPKTDLHVHLDGSIRIPTLIELAQDVGVDLPAYTEDGLRELVFKDTYNSLVEYLQGFQYCTAVLQRPDALDRVAYELALDNQAEGVRYLEVRFAPQLHINDDQSAEDVMSAVNNGLARARREFNRREAVRSGAEPPFEYGIIVCALRYFDSRTSCYYRNFISSHLYTTRNKRIFGLASFELAQMAVHLRDEQSMPIVGLDLAGQEAGYPPNDHAEAFNYVHRNFMKKTVHAGEAYGPESIFQSVTALHADRIGHGFFLLDPDMIRDPQVKDKERYVEHLSQYIADRRITIEVCPTSNLQTIPRMRDLTDVTNELDRSVRYMGLNLHGLKSCIIYGFKRSFFPGSYLRKRQYVRQIIDYYREVERRFHPELYVGAANGADPVPPEPDDEAAPDTQAPASSTSAT
jgi:adenosine deaminase